MEPTREPIRWTFAPSFIREVKYASGLVLLGAVGGLGVAVWMGLLGSPWLCLAPGALGAWLAYCFRRMQVWIAAATRGEGGVLLTQASLVLPHDVHIELEDIQSVHERRDMRGRPMDAVIVLRRRKWQTAFGRSVVVAIRRYRDGATMVDSIQSAVLAHRSEEKD